MSKISFALLEKPVKNNNNLSSRWNNVSFEINNGAMVTESFFLNLKQVNPPIAEAYWSCFPMGWFNLFISISQANLAMSF